MDVRRFQSGREMLEAVGPLLLAREAENSLLLGFASSDRPFGGCELGFGVFAGNRAAGALIQTSINEAILSACPDLAARSLGRALAAAGTRSRGVNGPKSAAAAAAAGFAERAGVSARVERRLLLHRLAGPADPGESEGRLRPARPGDTSLLCSWSQGFERDTRTPEHARGSEERVRQGIEAGRLYVLEGSAGPLAAASWSRPTPGTRTINCVFTPPEERGRGRGRAVTALLADRLLALGTAEVLIFTDADDPAPNRVYARVGFRPLAEFTHRMFEWPGERPARRL